MRTKTGLALPALLFLLFLPFLLLPPLASASASTFICDYARYSNPESSHQAEEHFSFTFILDEVRNTAYVLGTPGRHAVTVSRGVRQFTFVEVTDAGDVMRTTVASHGAFAHTRSTLTGSDASPSHAVFGVGTDAASTRASGPALRLDGRCSAVGGTGRQESGR